MNISTRIVVVICVAASIFTSCRKEPEAEAILCPSTPLLYGYKGPRGDSAGEYMLCYAGNVDLATGAMSTPASFNNRTYFNQGAYHMGENAYYTFKRADTADTLYRVVGGSVTLLSRTTGPAYSLEGIVYDRVHNKLFCIATTGTTSRVAELIVSGSAYSVNPVSYLTETSAHDNATTDGATGDIYFQSYNTASQTYSVRKYDAGSSSTPSVVYTSPAYIELWGLRHNRNDNMLYALRASPSTSGTYEFVRINPVGGIITVMANLGFDINPKHLSATINPCDNRYIFATQVLTAPSIAFKLYQLSMTGTVVTSYGIPEMYQGLDFWY